MKNTSITKIINGAVIATMDISKDSFTGYLRCPFNGAERVVKKYSITMDELMRFYQEAQAFKTKHGCSRIILGFESTGVYHVPIIQFFRDKPVELQQVNTLHVKRMKDITDNSPTKSDEKDPKVIADLIELRRGLQVVIPTGEFLSMRTIIQARERVIEHRTALTNQISNLVHILFPEFHRVFKDIHGKTARMILRECPLPKQLVALGLDQLSKKLYTTSRGRYGQDHARKLMIIARASLGVTDGLEHYVYEIHDLMSLCETIEATIEAYEKKLSDLIRQTPLGRLLLSMRGLGVITITAILGEYNGFAKFVTIAEVLKYAGMDITECSSGKRIGQRHLSKRGRSLLRKMLYLATLNLVRKGSVFYEQYQAYINRNKKKKVALIAIARKALRTIFAMSKSMCEFRENYIREYKTAA